MAGCKRRAFGRALARKKTFKPEQLETSKLRRCLNLWDLAALGVGSTLGVGVHVLVGSVALHLAGPSIVLSFLIAAVASLFAGLCYAEFGSRIPRAGSAYTYTYYTIGELVAFIVGWNMILESIFGTASVARGLSMYLDSMVNRSMSNWFQEVAPINAAHFSAYFDIFSFLVVIIIGVLLSIGVRESSAVNNVLAATNMVVILFIVIAGSIKADITNWNIPSEVVPEGQGSGGFFPHGLWGTLQGAAVCFYGFVGFDVITSTGEEVREPRRIIPHAILMVLAIMLLSYTTVAIVVTMMVPYYLQESVASVAMVFTQVGWDWARWVVSVGAVFGITSGLFGAMFPLPRLLYAMASDKLLFPWLAKVSVKRKSPVVGTLLSTCVIAILAGILELDQLVLMMCIGTLLSYTVVAACVVILRYGGNGKRLESNLCSRTPSLLTSRIANVVLLLFMCVCLSIALVGIYATDHLIVMAVLHAVCFLLIIIIMVLPQTDEDVPFKTPLVPIVPCLSIYINIHLMVLISVQTWIRVAIWILIGIPVYLICTFCYRRVDLNDDTKVSSEFIKNGRPPVQIIVESPTPPDTIKISSSGVERSISNIHNEVTVMPKQEIVRERIPFVTEEIIVQQAVVEDNEEKEAKIIDLLDQVIQAEEDSYGEIISLKEQKEEKEVTPTVIHRKSLSELSDAGSDASLGSQVLSKYDVIAQVHREDLPKVTEEEERIESDETEIEIENQAHDNEATEELDDDESETNSRTDESGYSDTLDKNTFNGSVEDPKDDAPVIPVPPPLDENFFANPTFKKSYTISSRPTKTLFVPPDEEKPRVSLQSNSSFEDGPMIFGSDKQVNFMSKLNNIFQTKITSAYEGDEQRKRSHSAGNLADSAEYSVNRDRPQIFLDLQKEIASKEVANNLRHVENAENNEQGSDTDEDNGLSREELKSKLENIFATGGPKLPKTRVMQSNPPTPEESYQTDTSSTESVAKLPKVDKNDTLKRQKAKFGEVLNSFKLSLNKGDDV